MAQAGEQLGLDGPVQRVVDALVDVRLLPPVPDRDLADLGDLPGGVVADAKPLEVAFLWRLFHLPQASRKGRTCSGAWGYADINLASTISSLLLWCRKSRHAAPCRC